MTTPLQLAIINDQLPVINVTVLSKRKLLIVNLLETENCKLLIADDWKEAANA